MANVKYFKETVEVNNAGIMLLGPYLPMIFDRLNYLSEGRREFKDKNTQVRAIFLLQYLLCGEEREYPETELFLNKLLVGMTDNEQPLPRTVQLTQEEMNMAVQMMDAVRSNWEKMRHASPRAFEEAFLRRKGHLSYDEERRGWILRVEERAYDILLDSIPWNFKICKTPWMEEPIMVEWR